MISTNIYLVIFTAMLSCCGNKEDNLDSSGINPDESVVFFDDSTTFEGCVSTKEKQEAGWANKVCF